MQGLLFGDKIDALLENVTVVAISLVAGGIILLFIDRLFSDDKATDASEPTYKSSFIIGSLSSAWPWCRVYPVSAATIIGGLPKTDQKSSCRFSFFLAVPTMLAATVYKLYQFYGDGYSFGSHEWTPLILGNVVAFIIAIFAMRSFCSISHQKRIPPLWLVPHHHRL